MDEISFDVIAFKPLTWASWKARYLPRIRISHALERIKQAKCGLLLADEATEMYYPWYKGGDWRDGKPKRAKIGKRWYLVRLPAVKVGTRYLVLDGCHRLKVLRPRLVLLDYVILRKGDEELVTDLMNKVWRDGQVETH